VRIVTLRIRQVSASSCYVTLLFPMLSSAVFSQAQGYTWETKFPTHSKTQEHNKIMNNM